MLALGLLGAQLSQDTDGALASVLDESAGDNLKGIGDGFVGPLLHALDTLGKLAEADGDSHLGGTTAGRKTGSEHDVAGHAHGVLKVALDLVKNVLGRAAEKDGAGLGVLALGEEAKVLVANLLNLEQTAPSADVRFLKILHSVDDGGAGRTSYSVVVGLAHTAQGCDVGLDEEVLGEIYVELA